MTRVSTSINMLSWLHTSPWPEDRSARPVACRSLQSKAHWVVGFEMKGVREAKVTASGSKGPRKGFC